MQTDQEQQDSEQQAKIEQAESEQTQSEAQDQDHGYQSGESLDIDPARRVELLKESRDGIIKRLSDVVEQGVSELEQRIGAMADGQASPEDAEMLRDAATLAGKAASQLRSDFTGHFGKLFERKLFGNAAVTDTDGLELALVDDSVMRDKLTRDRLVKRTRSKLDSEEVLGLRARFAALIDREWFDEHEQPAAPEFIYEALQMAIVAHGGQEQARAAVLNAFEPYVTANLNNIYIRANTYLRENDVLPRIRPRVEITPGGARRDAAADGEGSDTVDRATGASDEDTIVLPPPGEARDAILEVLAGQVAQGESKARSSAVRMLTEAKNFEGPDQQAPADELISQLDTLQGDESSHEQGALQSLSEQARQTGSPLDQLTVEIVSLIFDFLYDDPRIPNSVKNQLLRLQVVAVKAALIDRSFFASRQHPMRRLIDRTSELSCDPDVDASDDSSFVAGLHGLVDWVLDKFDRDLAVFEEAVEKLAELERGESTRRADALSDLTSRAESAENQALARDEATIAIDDRMDDLTPAFVREFLHDHWVPVLIDIRVAGEPDADSERWGQHLKMAEQLIWSVLPKSPSEISLMASLLPKTIGGINKGLQSLDDSLKPQHERFFNELMKWHTRIIKTAKSESQKAREDSRSSSVSMKKDGTVAFENLPEREQAEPQASSNEPIDQLVKGQKMELREPGAEPLRVKLAWISPAKKLYALSRFPDFARSLQRNEMSAMLQSGRLVKVQDVATLDRAIKAVGTDDADSQEGAQERGQTAARSSDDTASQLQKAFAQSCAGNAPS